MTEIVNKWGVTDAWVGWYGRAGLGRFTPYHPKESKKKGTGTALVSTKVNEDKNGDVTMTLVPSSISAVDAWHPVSEALLEGTIFKLNRAENVMSTDFIDIEQKLGANPFGPEYTHVKFDVTVDYEDHPDNPSSKRRVFATQLVWLQIENSEAMSLRIGNARATGYAWKDS